MATTRLNLRTPGLTLSTLQPPHPKFKHYSLITSHTPKHHHLLFTVSNSPFSSKKYNIINLFDSLKNRAPRLPPVLLGGSWWNLNGDDNGVKDSTAEPITARLALSRMWTLIGDDKWLLYLAVASLTIAAVSEISMPSILAASIFSAQRGETMLFSRSLRCLVTLTVISGIFSGLRSGCFSIANIILVKRFRERLYSAIVFQKQLVF